MSSLQRLHLHQELFSTESLGDLYAHIYSDDNRHVVDI